MLVAAAGAMESVARVRGQPQSSQRALNDHAKQAAMMHKEARRNRAT